MHFPQGAGRMKRRSLRPALFLRWWPLARLRCTRNQQTKLRQFRRARQNRRRRGSDPRFRCETTTQERWPPSDLSCLYGRRLIFGRSPASHVSPAADGKIAWNFPGYHFASRSVCRSERFWAGESVWVAFNPSLPCSTWKGDCRAGAASIRGRSFPWGEEG